jgi:DNA-directed RNA polymerase subunit L|tara:strand:- start:558 stop:1694 length:1137 start_codon:yes stop_codon:yes gene_type:complete
MEPKLKDFSEDSDILRFTLHGTEVSIANALRRTILSDIPIVVVETDTYENNKCNIKKNTGRLHNEIIKQRLSCIPIHSTLLRDIDDKKALPENYSLVVDVENKTENVIYVTTEDFRLRDNSSGKMLSKEEMDKLFPGLFPMNVQTQSYIDFARLRPKIGNDIPGEHLQLVADFSINNAKGSSMYNVVSKCAYGNTPDTEKAATIWDKQESKMRSEGDNDTDIRFQKENFRILDAQRHFVENSFDFVLQTVGIYDNKDIVRKSCAVLQNKFIDIVQLIDGGLMPILTSETTMDNCFDIQLEEEDYTIGKVLEYILYTKYYDGEKTLKFCGFKKYHPHDTKSIIRIAFTDKQDKSVVNHYLRDACVDAQQVFKDIYGLFK